jgi:hypothetical protein
MNKYTDECDQLKFILDESGKAIGIRFISQGNIRDIYGTNESNDDE